MYIRTYVYAYQDQFTSCHNGRSNGPLCLSIKLGQPHLPVVNAPSPLANEMDVFDPSLSLVNSLCHCLHLIHCRLYVFIVRMAPVCVFEELLEWRKGSQHVLVLHNGGNMWLPNNVHSWLTHEHAYCWDTLWTDVHMYSVDDRYQQQEMEVLCAKQEVLVAKQEVQYSLSIEGDTCRSSALALEENCPMGGLAYCAIVDSSVATR